MPKAARKKTVRKSKPKAVAYFSMEFALQQEIPNYAGGLGVLGADILKSCADKGVAAVGVTLAYHWNGNPRYAFDFTQYATKVKKTVTVQIEGRDIHIGAWKYSLKGRKSTVPIYMLTVFEKDNKPWDQDITKYLYASDKYTRLCQEAVLGIGGVRMLRALGYTNLKKLHLNEGHAALATFELLRENGYKEGEVKKLTTFTTHTPIKAGHDHFSYSLAERVIGDSLPWNVKKYAGRKELHMTKLALSLSGRSNSVSKRHQGVCKKMFPKYTFHNVTNGAHAERWISRDFARLYDRKLKGWRNDPSKLKKATSLPDGDVTNAHAKGKQTLIDFINKHEQFIPIPRKEITPNDYFDPDVLTLVFARRFVSYKRPQLLFHNIKKLRDIADKEIQVIFAARCHHSDTYCMNTVHDVLYLGRELRGHIRIAMIPNYTIDIARMLVQGADIWLNNPEPPKEASGTSGMKSAMNGGINLSILDGWWIEAQKMRPSSGWGFRGSTKSSKDAHALYERLEQAIKMYRSNPEAWTRRMKESIALGAHFNSHRCVDEYAKKIWR